MTPTACVLAAAVKVGVGFIVDVLGPCIGRIEHVLIEFRLQRRKLFHQRFEPLLGGGGQCNAGQTKVTEGILEQLALTSREPCGVAIEVR